ncbi:MAG TPA: hypothetical protein VK797_23120 [Tepidisphaeraceae bacterium]|nr:hypothetical protein [Tepidisphaeraceae bacterium]
MHEVRQAESSPLNREQFDASKAGDFYCETCPGNRGRTHYRYFWKKELLNQCTHEDFAAEVDVHRLEDTGRFQADVRINCRCCGLPFRFIGLPAGLDLNGAATSVDATEGRFSIAPKGEVVSILEGGVVGFSVRKTEANPTEGYPPGWPKCPGCGRPALDGHITCGDVRCSEGSRR